MKLCAAVATSKRPGRGRSKGLVDQWQVGPDQVKRLLDQWIGGLRPGASDEVDQLPPPDRAVVRVGRWLVQHRHQAIVKAHRLVRILVVGRTLVLSDTRGRVRRRLLTIPKWHRGLVGRTRARPITKNGCRLAPAPNAIQSVTMRS